MHTARHFLDLSLDDAMRRFSTQRIRQPYRRADKPLYLYGAGSLGKLASEFLWAVGVAPTLTFERNDDVPTKDAQVAVCVITSAYVPIERFLSERGFDDVVPFYDLAWNFRDKHPLGGNGWFADPLTGADQDAIRFVYDRWEDDRSRAHHLQFIAWRRIREEWTFAKAPLSNDDRYFIPEVVAALHEKERFLDGGANDGRVTNEFLRHVGRLQRAPLGRWNWEAIALVDPNLIPVEQFLGISQIDHLAFALADHNGTGYFRDAGLASRLGNAANGHNLTVRTIDSIDFNPTFIKIHLEGGELNALRGGRETILKHRPIIAATVYHNSDGIYRTAEWLMETLQDYRFLFRNHCWQGAGAVVYAIPCERKQ